MEVQVRTLIYGSLFGLGSLINVVVLILVLLNKRRYGTRISFVLWLLLVAQINCVASFTFYMVALNDPTYSNIHVSAWL